MGSLPDEEGRSDDETLHWVKLSEPFEMAATPVTVRQYRAFDEHHECPGGPDHPVTRVSWWRAWLFARWVRGGLPTEAQWELACRAGTRTPWFCGDAETELERFAWYRKNANEPQPVATRAPNPWGLYDMHGNVWEWCRDWYGPYPEGGVTDPLGPLTGAQRVVRGGTCWSVARGLRSAYRSHGLPGGRVRNLGFRVVRPTPELGCGR